MMKRIQGWLFPQLSGQSFKDDAEIYLYLILCIATILAGALHVALLILMLSSGIIILAVVNLFSLLIYGVSFALNLKRQYAMSSLLITVEIIAYTAISVYYIGTSSYIFLFLLVAIVLQLIVSYTKAKIRACVVIFLWLIMNTVISIGFTYVPPIDLGDKLLTFSLFTTNMMFVALIAELSIGFFIKKLIEFYNEQKLRDMTNQAHTDSLTGLFNRHYAEMFFDRLSKEKTGQRWCVAILDVDDFKLVNDQNGHLVGDAVLKHMADVMRSSLRKSDVIFRWGGEEFLLFLDNVDLDTAYIILEKLRINLAKTAAQTPSATVYFTATIGVVEVDPLDLQGSISRCDRKLYEGKNQGKNMVVM